MNAILMVLRTGMQWNALDAPGICNSKTAHRRFQEWRAAGVFHEIWRQGLLEYDEKIGIDWSFMAADGAMTQGAARRPENRRKPNGQSEKGAKRSVVTEAADVPVGIAHDGANRNDHKLLKQTLDSIPVQRPEPTKDAPQGACLDKAYDNQEVRDLLADLRLTPHIRTRSEETEAREHNPEWRPRRWVVEACHSWLNRNRAILIRWSKKDENHLALLQLASGLIAFKKVHAATPTPAC
jgi:putative transposase